MAFLLRISLCTLLLAAVSQQIMGYEIHGHLTGYETKWKNRIFLAAIRSIDDINMAADRLKINEAAIDNNGDFLLTGNNLPNENEIYRIYLTSRTDYGMQLTGGPDPNFTHLVFNNNSKIIINADLRTKPFYDAEITGTTDARNIKLYYAAVNNLLFQNYRSPYTEKGLDDPKMFDLIKNSIGKSNSPYFTILVLADLNFTTVYTTHKDYLMSVIGRLEKQLPGNQYVSELNDRLLFQEFRESPYKKYLNARIFFVLFAVSVLLFLGLFYLLIAPKFRPPVKRVAAPLEKLTQKELEIAALIADGKSNKEIAALLFIEISTVKTHVGNVYQKLTITDRKQLTAMLSQFKRD